VELLVLLHILLICFFLNQIVEGHNETVLMEYHKQKSEYQFAVPFHPLYLL